MGYICIYYVLYIYGLFQTAYILTIPSNQVLLADNPKVAKYIKSYFPPLLSGVSRNQEKKTANFMSYNC